MIYSIDFTAGFRFEVLKVTSSLLDAELGSAVDAASHLAYHLLVHVGGKVLHNCFELSDGFRLASGDVGHGLTPKRKIHWV